LRLRGILPTARLGPCTASADTAATRWLRAGIDVRTVQAWLGQESLATTQKCLEPSNETEKQLNKCEEFVERARLPVPEILKEFRRLNPDPRKLAAEDAAEEEQMMEAEDAGLAAFAAEGKSVPTAEEIMDEAGLCLTSSGDREFGCQTST
jgi:hypothetical protein